MAPLLTMKARIAMPKVAKKEVVKREPSSAKMIDVLARRIKELEEEIAALKAPKVVKEVGGPDIQRVETFNDEEVPVIDGDTPLGLKMNQEEKIQSMRNAIKVLPPNYVVDGRHLKKNIQALVGFMVTDEMMDKAYEGITHEAY